MKIFYKGKKTKSKYKNSEVKSYMAKPIIAIYTFNSSTDTLPTFNSEFDNTVTTITESGTFGYKKDMTFTVPITDLSQIISFSILEYEDVSTYIKKTTHGPDYIHIKYDYGSGGPTFTIYNTGDCKISVDEPWNENITAEVVIEKKNYEYTDVDNGNGTTTRTITSDALPSSISFNGKTGLVSLSYLDTSNVTSGNGMFDGCSNLISIDTTSFNTSKIKDMTAMFSDCPSLTELDLSSLDFSNVTNMYAMFANDVSLTELDLSNLIVNDTVTLDSMFYRVENLKELILLNSNKYTIDKLFRYLPSETGTVLTTMPYTPTKEGWTARIVVAEYIFNSNNDTKPVFNDGFGDVMIECVV